MDDSQITENSNAPNLFEESSVDEHQRNVSVNFLKDLINKVVRGFVSSLHNDVPDIWQSFNEVLHIIQPYSTLIAGDNQLMHYVERAYHHVCQRPNCGLDISALALAFPQSVSKLQEDSTTKKRPKFHSTSKGFNLNNFSSRQMGKQKKGIIVPKDVMISSGKIFEDINAVDSKYLFEEDNLCLNDLHKSLPFVVYEISLREASWGKPLGIATTAVNTDLAETLQNLSSSCESPALQINRNLSTVDKLEQSKNDSEEERHAKLPCTGREIVEKLVKGNFLGLTKFAYLIQAESKRYDPYNLIVVPRNKIKSEHFVVSSHAILHVLPNRPSELVPLSEWYNEAILFSAVVKYGFFKNFLLAKMFLRWKHVKKLIQFKVLREHVSKSILSCTGRFSSALLRIYSQVIDMDQVILLPLNDHACKPLKEFNNITMNILKDGHECIKMFYTYCLSVVNKTIEKCFKHMESCKDQLKQMPKGQHSLSVVKEIKAAKSQNLLDAKHEIVQLEKFVQLVEYILIEILLKLAKKNICLFVSDVLECEAIKDNGLFVVDVKFDKHDHLVMNPNVKVLQGSLYSALECVLNILCQSSNSLHVQADIDAKEHVTRVGDSSSSSDRYIYSSFNFLCYHNNKVLDKAVSKSLCRN